MHRLSRTGLARARRRAANANVRIAAHRRTQRPGEGFAYLIQIQDSNSKKRIRQDVSAQSTIPSNPVLINPGTGTQSAGMKFLISEGIMRVPATPASTPGASPGSIMVYPVTRVPATVTPKLLVESFRMSPMGVPAATFEELAPSKTYVRSKLRSRLSHHPNSGLQGGVDREGPPGGP